VRPCSALSAPYAPRADLVPPPPAAPTANGDDSTSLQLTPRAAAEIAARQKAEDKDKLPPKKRVKHVATDKVIELKWEAGRLDGKDRFKDVRRLFQLPPLSRRAVLTPRLPLSQPEYLPSSRLHLALLETTSSDLLPRPLPKTSKNAPSLELFAPPGLLAPELQELWVMPTRREQIRLEGRERKEDRAVEQGRRAASVLSSNSHLRADGADLGLDAFDHPDLNQDFGGGFDNDLGGFDHGVGFDLDDDPLGAADPLATPKRPSKKRRTTEGGAFAPDDADPLATPAQSVLSALAREDLPQYHSEGPLAIFDDVSSVGAARSHAGTATPSQSQSQLLSQSLGTEQERVAAAGGEGESLTQKSGSISLQSRNTRKAVRVLKEQLDADVEADRPEEKKVEFTQVSQQVRLLSPLRRSLSCPRARRRRGRSADSLLVHRPLAAPPPRSSSSSSSSRRPTSSSSISRRRTARSRCAARPSCRRSLSERGGERGGRGGRRRRARGTRTCCSPI